MVANTWIAASAGNWSDDANWSLGHSPIDGEDPTFDATSVNNCAADDATPTGVLTITAGYSGTITQTSDMHISGYSQAGGTFTGVTTKWVYCSGSIVKTSGTFTGSVAKFVMNGTGLINAQVTFNTLIINGNYSQSSTISYVGVSTSLIINGDYVVPTGRVLVLYGSVDVYGSLSGLGTFNIKIGLAHSLNSLDRITLPYVSLQNDGASAYKGTLTSDIDGTFTITISCAGAGTTTIDLNGHNLGASQITVAARGILQCGNGTITVNSLDSSAGTITEETAQWIFDGAGTVKTNGTDKFYDVIVRDDSLVSLGSNVVIANEYVTAGEVITGAYTITHETPSKRFMAPMVNPIVRNPKRSPIYRGRFTKNFEKGVV